MSCISYKKHAMEMMELRRITDGEVHEAKVNIQVDRPSKKSDYIRVLVGVTSAGRRLKLVLAYDEEPPALVTVAGVDEYP